ncbi:hypothetical protein Gorai_003470 [Gossypium raimondii]|uniref:Uncharacterized protein n=1 Tax=Gossypium raimondii TaxID=29730 RepID=A0A7J8QPW3_GOSRA|nr:hypothetical protein [Gossypium raimondii]
MILLSKTFSCLRRPDCNCRKHPSWV